MTREEFVRQLPESVVQYLSDKKVSTAVNNLDGIKNDGLAVGLRWDEFERFLEARAAAHLVRTEYPLALWRLWEVVWENSMKAKWQTLSVDETGDACVGPLTTWNQGALARCHQFKKLQLYTMVEMDVDKTCIAFVLEDEKGRALFDHAQKPYEWHDRETDYEGYMVATWPHAITSNDLPWNEVLAARDLAMQLVEDAIAAHA